MVLPAIHEALVKALVVADHPFECEFALYFRLRGSCQRSRAFRIAQKLADCFRQGIRVRRRYQKPGMSIFDDLLGATRPSHDDWFGGSHGLKRDQGKTFTNRGKHKHVEFAEDFRNIATKTQENESVLETQSLDQPQQWFCNDRIDVADGDKTYFWHRGGDFAGRLNKKLIPFAFSQISYHAD